MSQSSPQPELSIVLTAHNRADLVGSMLETVAGQEWEGDWDIVLVDNDSDDETLTILRDWADRMPVPTTVVEATARRGLSFARGSGVAASSARSIAFLDDDDLIAPGYVAAIGTALRDEQLVGPRHEHFLLNDEPMASYRDGYQSHSLPEVFGVPMALGGGFSCRRALWDDLAGQTEAFGYGSEDADFALRAHRAGVTAALVPDAVYHVRHRTGLRSTFHQSRRTAMARVKLYRMHREAVDVGPERLTAVVRSWAGMMLRLPSLRRPGPRLVWGWQLGRRVGHLQGSIRERTWFP